MISEFLRILSTWQWLDTWIVTIAALASMACALPGNYLLLRRQSMMGDALSHTVLPGIVIAFLFAYWLRTSEWISDETYAGLGHAAMFAGAVVIGILTAVLTEAVQRLGRMEGSASLGVVYTTLFAIGLLLVRLATDRIHIDAECVLYGKLEATAFSVGWSPPFAVYVNGGVLLFNLLLVFVFFKELRISTFDPALATTMGINATAMHYALMAVTAMTLVAAFESVGSILVIAMLIVPAATARLLTHRLPMMIALSLVIAALIALLGHALAITVPSILFRRLGFETATDISASTAGSMAATAGLLFGAAMLFAPQQGIVSQLFHRWRLSLRIAREDLLAALYRREERSETQGDWPAAAVAGVHPMTRRWATHQLKHKRLVESVGDHVRLTESGRSTAQQLIRGHRLWESYLAEHFTLPADHLHESAHQVEHFLDSNLQSELADELGRPDADPHGREIPTDQS